MSQKKMPELDAKHQAILKKMMQLPENKTCADCHGPSPRWASTNLGTFLCISCSGIHRKLGTHISQVRSVTLDTWTPAQIIHFTKFGNARAAQYFEACIPSDFKRPPHGDSMQMERFIRDKYEHRRYITVENGGQGGGPTTSQYPGSRASSGAGLGPRPSQVRGTASYDNATSSRRTGLSYNSYSGRFGSGSTSMSNRTPGFSQSRATGAFKSQAAAALRIRPGSAIQRAGTMKELINMGFSAEYAARAVEATEGDLQKAVDWVLAHTDQGSRSNASVAPPPPKQAPQKDLLDFDDFMPAPQASSVSTPTQKVQPKTLDTEVLMSNSNPSISKKAGREEADFADFGAFESALPAMPAVSKPGIPTTNGSLASKIQNIYKQSPPQRPQPSHSGMPNFARLDQHKQVASPLSPARTRPSPKLMAQKAAEAKKQAPSVDLGLTTFTGLASSQLKLSSPSTTTKPTNRGQPGGAIFKTQNGPAAPPPPPPPQSQVDVSAPNSVQEPFSAPPPPDTPPPADEPFSHNMTSKSETELPTESSLQPKDVNKDCETTVNSAEATAPQENKEEEEEEEEDPFAALSMMAMSSAKSRKEAATTVPRVKVQDSASNVAGTPDSIGKGDKPNSLTENAIGRIDLDQLLG